MILHIRAQKTLEQISLLGDKVTSASDHFAQPAVHLMLILALGHAVQLAQLFDEFVHCEHGGGQGLTLLIDVLGALNHFVVEDLIRINEIVHFMAENSTI